MKAVELFAGAGGLGIGLSQAGFNPLQVVEWDRWACDTIRENRKLPKSVVRKWPEPIEEDVRLLDFDELEGKVDLVSGGPPCQPFSLGGKHRAFDDERDMWPQAVRVVRQVKPRAFIFENVKGLTRASFATYLAYIEHQLRFPELERRRGESWLEHLAKLEAHQTSGSQEGLRYNLIYRVLNAADYGVPQRRERVVFVGFRSDLNVEWSFPNATHSYESLLWEQTRSNSYWERHKIGKGDRTLDARAHARGISLIEKPITKPWRTVRDAIGDLPDPESSASGAPQFLNHRFQRGARRYPGHTGSPLDEAAKTLKAGVHGVPGGENMLLRPDGTVRYFTVREAARLQTFPDEFRFHGSWTETMRQLGNAVPVDLAEFLARRIARTLNQVGGTTSRHGRRIC